MSRRIGFNERREFGRLSHGGRRCKFLVFEFSNNRSFWSPARDLCVACVGLCVYVRTMVIRRRKRWFQNQRTIFIEEMDILTALDGGGFGVSSGHEPHRVQKNVSRYCRVYGKNLRPPHAETVSSSPLLYERSFAWIFFRRAREVSTTIPWSEWLDTGNERGVTRIRTTSANCAFVRDEFGRSHLTARSHTRRGRWLWSANAAKKRHGVKDIGSEMYCFRSPHYYVFCIVAF